MKTIIGSKEIKVESALSSNRRLQLAIIKEAVELITKFPDNNNVFREQSNILLKAAKELKRSKA